MPGTAISRQIRSETPILSGYRRPAQLAPQVPATLAGVQVSFDGGKTWQRAQVRPLGGGRFRATFTAPPSARVSLRSTAHDAAGNGLTETILNSYQTGAS